MVEDACLKSDTQLLVSAGRQVQVLLAVDASQKRAWLSEALGCIQNIKRLFLAAVDGEFSETVGLSTQPFDVKFWDEEHPAPMSVADLAVVMEPFADIIGVRAVTLASQYNGCLSVARHFAEKQGMSIELIWVRTLRQLRERRARMETTEIHKAVQFLLVASQSTGDVETCFSWVQTLSSERRASVTIANLKADLKVLLCVYACEHMCWSRR